MTSDSEGEKAGIPLLLSPSPSPQPHPPNSSTSQKRKRPSADKATTATDRPQSKRAAKRRKSKAPTDIDDSALDTEAGLNLTIAHMDPQLLADHIAQRTKRFQPDLSLVELEDQRIASASIRDTTAFTSQRVMTHLPDFLSSFSQDSDSVSAAQKGTTPSKKSNADKKGIHPLATAPKANGSPHTLLIASSGIRAADLTRSVREFQTAEAKIAKLFAKHIKLAESVQLLQSTRIGIGVGTPQRVIDLLETGALKTSALKRVVLDASHIDEKRRGLLDMKDSLVPVVKLLCRPNMKGVEVLVY